MTLQKANNHTIEDLVDSEGDESSVAEVRRMMIRMFNELKEDIQKQFNESQENMDKKKNQEDIETTK
jgi:molybdenum-dependent DNA-binding transcriptional regulator ModE